MARFKKEYSAVSEALNKLSGLAENLISMQTNRQIQLGREKESRMIDAYAYMLGDEDRQIGELETAIDSVTTNLEDRGIELKSLSDEYKSMPAEELLAAANQGALELLNAKLQDRTNYRNSLQKKKVNAQSIKRHIDLFEDALALTDPKHYGDPNIIEAEDVAKAAIDYGYALDAMYAPEMKQLLDEMTTKSSLEKLQSDYYARLARESQEKITASTAATTDASIKIKTLEDVKKETLEGVKAMTYQPVSKMIEEYRNVITLQSEISGGEDLTTGQTLNNADITKKQAQVDQEHQRIGSILVPWAFSAEQAGQEAQIIQNALTKAGNGNYEDLISFFKKGHAQYTTWVGEGNPGADRYRADIQSILGIDIASQDWVSQLDNLWRAVNQADIEQATEALKAGMQYLPDLQEQEDRQDDLSKFLEEGW